MSARRHGNYGRLYVVTLRVKQNSFVLFFELVAKSFYVSRNLFPDFGYAKLKCVFDLPQNNILFMQCMYMLVGQIHFQVRLAFQPSMIIRISSVS